MGKAQRTLVGPSGSTGGTGQRRLERIPRGLLGLGTALLGLLGWVFLALFLELSKIRCRKEGENRALSLRGCV